MRRPTRGYGRTRRGGGGLGGRLPILIIGLIGLAIYWFSNQQTVPFSGRNQHVTIPVEQAAKLGAQSYVQILRGEAGGVLCETSDCNATEAEIVRKVRKIGTDLERAAIQLERELLDEGYNFTPVADKFDWQYNVVPSTQPNAFCLPGGYVAVYTQIMDVAGDADGTFEPDDDLRDLDKLAVIMGHEIGHALAHHGAERMSQQKVAQLGQAAVGLGMGDMGAAQQQAVMQAFGMAAKGSILKFSREHETEADKIGLDLLVRACYDPREAPELWERMGKLGGGQRPPEWMSTHPASETRADNFRKWMPDAVAYYQANCAAR